MGAAELPATTTHLQLHGEKAKSFPQVTYFLPLVKDVAVW